MRSTHVATALAAFTAGLTAAAAVRRLVGRRRSRTVVAASAGPVPARDAVVVPFVRRAVTAPAPAAAAERPEAPVRCGDSGGRTKAGAPCAARGTSGGRCHHHRLAA